jgi:hypothetical protein
MYVIWADIWADIWGDIWEVEGGGPDPEPQPIPENANWTRYVKDARKRRRGKVVDEQTFNEIPKPVEAKPLPVKTMADISALFTRQAMKANAPPIMAVPGLDRVETSKHNDEEDIELLLLSL